MVAGQLLSSGNQESDDDGSSNNSDSDSSSGSSSSSSSSRSSSRARSREGSTRPRSRSPSGDTDQRKKKRRRYSEDYIKYGFTVVKIGSLNPKCVICSKVMSSAARKDTRLLESHLSSCHRELKDKDVDYFKRKQVDMERSPLSREEVSDLQFSVSLKIAQQKEEYSMGEALVLPCVKEMLRAKIGNQAANRLNSLSLSNSIIHQCIVLMSEDILEQVLQEVKVAPLGLFSLQIDETLDLISCSRLLVFARYIKDGDFKSEFLFSKRLEAKTSREDIFSKVNEFFVAKELQWKNVCGITMEGTDCLLGFKNRIKAFDSGTMYVQCVMRRLAMFTDSLPLELKKVYKTSRNMVKYMQADVHYAEAFNLESLPLYDQETLAHHTEARLVFHVPEILKGVYEAHEKIKECMAGDSGPEAKIYLAVLEDYNWVSWLAYLVDITTRLHDLRKALKHPNVLITHFIDKINAFVMKLGLWQRRVKMGIWDMFPRLAERVDMMESEPLGILISAHLLALQTELQKYLPDVSEWELKLLRDPFNTKIESVTDAIQEEFIDLLHDSSAQDLFNKESVVRFWCKMVESYPHVAKAVIRNLLLFPSATLCESGLSSLLMLMSTMNLRVSVNADLRCAVAKTAPRMSKLVKQKINKEKD